VVKCTPKPFCKISGGYKGLDADCDRSRRHPSVTNDNGLASPFDEGVFLLKEMRLDKNNTKVKEK